MYAYNREQYEYEQRLHVVRPAAPKIRHIQKKKVVKKKKVNPIVSLFKMGVALSFLSAFAFIVYPTCYNNLVNHPLIHNDEVLS